MLNLQRQRASIQTIALVMLCGSVVVLLAFAWAPDRTFLRAGCTPFELWARALEAEG